MVSHQPRPQVLDHGHGDQEEGPSLASRPHRPGRARPGERQRLALLPHPTCKAGRTERLQVSGTLSVEGS